MRTQKFKKYAVDLPYAAADAKKKYNKTPNK